MVRVESSKFEVKDIYNMSIFFKSIVELENVGIYGMTMRNLNLKDIKHRKKMYGKF